MIVVTKAGTNLAEIGEADMFIAEDEASALQEWREAYEMDIYVELSPPPAQIDVYALVPLVLNKEVKL